MNVNVSTHDVAVATYAIHDLEDMRTAVNKLVGLCILAGVPLSDVLGAINGTYDPLAAVKGE